jgi:hypothetical protein
MKKGNKNTNNRYSFNNVFTEQAFFCKLRPTLTHQIGSSFQKLVLAPKFRTRFDRLICASTWSRSSSRNIALSFQSRKSMLKNTKNLPIYLDLGPMLWSQFSSIFDNFRQKMGVFLKNHCCDKFFEKTSSSLRKNVNFFAKFFGENVFKSYVNVAPLVVTFLTTTCYVR